MKIHLFTRVVGLALAAALTVGALAQEDQPPTPVPLPEVIDRPGRGPGSGRGPEMPAEEIHLFDAWVRPVEVGGTSALYLTIGNLTANPLTLTGARVDFADMTELHESIIEEGMGRMRHLPDGIAIPAGARAVLAPGGLHIMLIDATRALAAGDVVTVSVTLTDAAGVATDYSALARVTDDPPPERFYYFIDTYATEADLAIEGLSDPLATPEADAPIQAIALFGTLVNWGAPTVNLTGASAAFAITGEIRQSISIGGEIVSQPVPFAPAPVGARLILSPASFFALLGQLDAEAIPAIGDLFTADLLLDDGTTITLPFEMREPVELVLNP